MIFISYFSVLITEKTYKIIYSCTRVVILSEDYDYTPRDLTPSKVHIFHINIFQIKNSTFETLTGVGKTQPYAYLISFAHQIFD